LFFVVFQVSLTVERQASSRGLKQRQEEEGAVIGGINFVTQATKSTK
jgi:hypothetical protein